MQSGPNSSHLDTRCTRASLVTENAQPSAIFEHAAGWVCTPRRQVPRRRLASQLVCHGQRPGCECRRWESELVEGVPQGRMGVCIRSYCIDSERRNIATRRGRRWFAQAIRNAYRSASTELLGRPESRDRFPSTRPCVVRYSIASIPTPMYAAI